MEQEGIRINLFVFVDILPILRDMYFLIARVKGNIANFLFYLSFFQINGRREGNTWTQTPLLGIYGIDFQKE